MTTRSESNLRQDDLEWVLGDPPVLRPLRGQWIAVVERTVVASGTSADDVVDDLVEQGISDALLMQVPTERELRSYLIA